MMSSIQRLRQAWRVVVISHVVGSYALAAIAAPLHLFRPYAWLMRLWTGKEMSKNLACQFRLVLERLGPTFIKFGQMLSTRVDLLPMNLVLELKKLQDDVPPESFACVKETLERSFKKPLLGKDGVFLQFDEQAVAAASIAQVHFAKLHDGRDVAVKIRRPSIHRTIKSDLALLRLLAKIFNRYFPQYKRLKAESVVQEFAQTLTGELNLRAEAAHAHRFAELFNDHQDIHIPEVIWDYTQTAVLTTERVYGIPIDEREALQAAGHDCLKICERTAELFFYMVFMHGYFHADMHPGNVFIDQKGRIVLVDFGIIGHLDMASRRYIGDMLLSFLNQDYRHSAKVHLDAGYVPGDTNLSAFEDALREIAVPIFNRPLNEISIAELLLNMFAVTERFQMETQPQLLLLQKSMVVVEGVARDLAQETNIWMVARPLIKEWSIKHLGPLGKMAAIHEQLQQQGQAWLQLPQQLQTWQQQQQGQAAVHRPIMTRILGLLLFAIALLALQQDIQLVSEPSQTNLAIVTLILSSWLIIRR